MTTSRQPKKRTGKAFSKNSDPRWLAEFLERARTVQKDFVEFMDFCRSIGGAHSVPAPASSDRSAFNEVVNDHCATRAREEAQDATILAAARARLAAREQGGGGKPQRRIESNKGACGKPGHAKYGGIVCAKCVEDRMARRGSKPRKRSSRSR